MYIFYVYIYRDGGVVVRDCLELHEAILFWMVIFVFFKCMSILCMYLCECRALVCCLCSVKKTKINKIYLKKINK